MQTTHCSPYGHGRRYVSWCRCFICKRAVGLDERAGVVIHEGREIALTGWSYRGSDDREYCRRHAHLRE